MTLASKVIVMKPAVNELGTKTAALQVINPHHDSLLFCDCAETLPAAEIQESLEGICHRCQQRSLKLENVVHKALPVVDVVLDIYHFLMRMTLTSNFEVPDCDYQWDQKPSPDDFCKWEGRRILDQRRAVSAIVTHFRKVVAESQASKKPEIVDSENLHANKVYADQMNHVWKGYCIEGSLPLKTTNKACHWLSRDPLTTPVLGTPETSNKSSPFSLFDASTFGSHHTRLANYTAKFWNRVQLSKPGSSPDLLALPEMTAVSSNETFGLVNSECTTTFRGLFSEVKAAPKMEDPSLLTLGLDEAPDLDLDLQVKHRQVVNEFGIDLSLFNMPMFAPETQGRGARQLDMRRAWGTSVCQQEAANRDYSPSRYDQQCHLCLPPDSTGLTRSQHLFTTSTSIHIDSLMIGRSNEFFIFLKLRARHKWLSFQMSLLKWVEATNLFNAKLNQEGHGDLLEGALLRCAAPEGGPTRWGQKGEDPKARPLPNVQEAHVPKPDWIPREPQMGVLLRRREVKTAGQRTPRLSPAVPPAKPHLLIRCLDSEFRLSPCPEGLLVKGDELEEGRGGDGQMSYLWVDCLQND
ncbi:hypothetical protein EDB86DRAFT_2828745 [Lactarius hatsudake]|nr:hypothetical protein EDB86DRAFT_2828745 [Lactarius hatsudake]